MTGFIDETQSYGGYLFASAVKTHRIIRYYLGWRDGRWGEKDSLWDRDDRWDDGRWKSGNKDYFTLPVSATMVILALCILFSLARLIAPVPVMNYLALNPALVVFRPWTLVTHIFVHADFGHLFWNMLALFFFGTELERRLGERMFLVVFLVSGVFGGIVEMMFSTGFMLGASGGLMGVMGCLALIAPEIRVIIFPIPIPIGIPVATVLLALMDIFYQVSLGGADGIGHVAHLAGLGAGLVFGKMLETRKMRYY